MTTSLCTTARLADWESDGFDVRVAGGWNGNCLFECVAQSLHELQRYTELTTSEARGRIANWLDENREARLFHTDPDSPVVQDEYNTKLYNSYDHFITELKKPGIYGDFLAIHAACQVFV